MQTPVPQEKPEATTAVVDVVTVTEKPAETTEPSRSLKPIARWLQASKRQRPVKTVVDRVEVDQASGRIKEDVEVVETTQTATDTVIVDKATGDTMETVEVGNRGGVLSGLCRLNSFPDPHATRAACSPDPSSFRPTNTPPTLLLPFALTRQHQTVRRIKMICDAFIASQAADADSATQNPSDQMVTIWPVSSTDRATDLNRAPRNQVCQEAVDRYGLAMGHRAISIRKRPAGYWTIRARICWLGLPARSKAIWMPASCFSICLGHRSRPGSGVDDGLV